MQGEYIGDCAAFWALLVSPTIKCVNNRHVRTFYFLYNICCLISGEYIGECPALWTLLISVTIKCVKNRDLRTLFFLYNICCLISGESIGEGPVVCGLFLAKLKMCKQLRGIPGRVLTRILAWSNARTRQQCLYGPYIIVIALCAWIPVRIQGLKTGCWFIVT